MNAKATVNLPVENVVNVESVQIKKRSVVMIGHKF